MIYGYCRATTKKQLESGAIAVQKQEIKNRYYEAVFYEESSIDINNLEVYGELVDIMKEGDVFAVSSMDRFSKSIEDACEKIDRLREKNIAVHIINIGKIDDSILGNIIYDTIKAMRDFNNSVLVERIQNGKSRAKQMDGFREGRPKKYKDEEIKNALELLNKYSYKKVEEITGISKSTLIRAKKNS